MSDLLQYAATGIALGSIYALVALGFVTVFAVTGAINFAQGEFVMLGAMIAAQLVHAGMPLPLAAVLAVAGAALAGAALHELGLRPALGRLSPLGLILITIGAATAIRGMALIAWGTDPFTVPAFTPGPSLDLAGAAVNRQTVWIVATTAIVLALVWFLFQRTATGRALRACAADLVAARLVGVDPRRMGLVSLTLSGAVGAIGGVVLAPITFASYDMGLMLGLKGFVGAVIGGLASAPGAVAGGLLLGLLEAFATPISSGYKDALAFVVLIAVMLLRPGGIFRGSFARGRI